MSADLLDREYDSRRDALSILLGEVGTLAEELGARDRAATLADVRRGVGEPFLFVVVGEVKAGKSSFINALLGAEVCAVAPDPCTDRVNQIVFAEEPFERELSPLLRKVGVHAEILRAIAIVDTPGTGAIIREHQTITENFIPHCDLALFVFAATNPHTGAAWDMLDFVKEQWRKKVVFILAQSDRATAAELEVNRRAVAQYAVQRGLRDAAIFATSAERERSGDKGSGFSEVREFIRETVTGAKPARAKLESAASVAAKVLDEIGEGLETQRAGLRADEAIARQIETRITAGEQRSGREIDALVARLEKSYDLLATDLKEEFEKGLSIGGLLARTFGPLIGQSKNFREWIEELKLGFSRRLAPRVAELAKEGADHYLDGVRLLLNDLIVDLQRARPAGNVNAPQIFMKLPGWHSESADGVIAKLRELLEDDRFADALAGSGTAAIPATIGAGVATVIGVVTAAVTHVLVVDITGGLLTGLAAAGAGLFVLFKRHSLIRDFRRALDEGRERFAREVEERLRGKLGVVYAEIQRGCSPFTDEVKDAHKRLAPLDARLAALRERLRVMREGW